MYYGASCYEERSGADLSPREIEAMAFRHVNELLTRSKSIQTRRAALAVNYRLWSILLRAADNVANPLPEILRNDVISLATWVLVETNNALNSRQSLDQLISVNMDMLEGLSSSAAGYPAAALSAEAYPDFATVSGSAKAPLQVELRG